MSRYEWDRRKAARNIAVHGVTFEEAESAVEHPLARFHPDPDHSGGEARFMVVGYSASGTLLAVIVSERGPQPRMISARRATKRERDAYEDRP